MAHLHDIVFDSTRPAALARFWAAALDGYAVAPSDEAEVSRLPALGVDGPEDDPAVLVAPEGPGPRLWFQHVPAPGRARNRVHLDLRAADVAEEAGRMIALGARVLARHDDHVVLADPEGNAYCVFPLGP